MGDRLATIDMGQKLGGYCWEGGCWVSYLTQCSLGQGLPSYQVASWSLQPFGHNRRGPKCKSGGCALFREKLGPPPNTMSPGPRPTSVPSGILLHPAVWPHGPKTGGLCPFGEGSWVPICYNMARAEAYLHATFHLDPSNSLATIHQRYRQTGQTDRQRSDSIGQTVL